MLLHVSATRIVKVAINWTPTQATLSQKTKQNLLAHVANNERRMPFELRESKQELQE